MNKVKSTLNKNTDTKPDTRVRGANRRELVFRGVESGKSRRQIATELGVDEGTVRRDLRILLLPESCLTAILNGAEPEKYLRDARHQAAEDAKRLRLAEEKQAAENSKSQRLAEEKLNGCHSDALARLLLRWLDRKLSVEARAFEEQTLEIVGRANWRIGDQLATPSPKPARTLALCSQGDEPSYMPDKIEFLASALLQALPLITPEWAIRYRAIDKAMRVIQNPRQCPPELFT